MSHERKNQVLVWIGILTGLGTIGGTMMQVGDLKGTIIQRVNDHDRRLDAHEAKIDRLSERVHGVASQVGKIPGKVAERLEAETGRP